MGFGKAIIIFLEIIITPVLGILIVGAIDKAIGVDWLGCLIALIKLHLDIMNCIDPFAFFFIICISIFFDALIYIFLMFLNNVIEGIIDDYRKGDKRE